MQAGIAFLPPLISGVFSFGSVTVSISGLDLQTTNFYITDIFFKTFDQCLVTEPIIGIIYLNNKNTHFLFDGRGTIHQMKSRQRTQGSLLK